MTTSDLLNFDYDKNKKEIFDRLISSISDAVKSNGSQVYIKDLQIVDESIDVVAQRENWPDCLQKALSFYKSVEDYESCANCQKLLDKIQTSTPKKAKSNNARKKA
jgi:ABC-type phosphate transport system ATPase subunit